MLKRTLIVLALSLAGSIVAAQAQSLSDHLPQNGAYKQSPFAPKWAEGEVIVKFKGSGSVSLKKNAKGKIVSSSDPTLDRTLADLGMTEMEQLMPLTGGKNVGRRARSVSGRIVESKDLSNLVVVRYDKAKGDVPSVVKKLKDLDQVEYAEPNYYIYPCGEESDTPFDDPFYPQQWWTSAINLPALWSAPKITNRRPIIAILDSGVDISHPDLAANIWTNELEANGYDGVDDDGNGLIDDVHGWAFNTNAPISSSTYLGRDFTGHGTHCAGIAAAAGNNGIGVVGANPEALIMPVKIMNGDGEIFIAARGIDYAIANGADVISMSWGSDGASFAILDAVNNSVANNIIPVAAAGNNGLVIYRSEKGNGGGLVFPAAQDGVIGVMATGEDGNLARFSNYDPDGPFFSEYGQWNYNVKAPGVDILSTYPGGQYRRMSGTSQATPLVAGAISRIMMSKDLTGEETLAFIGDVSESKNDKEVFDALRVLSWNEKTRGNAVQLTSVDLVGEDDDTEIDAGETVKLYPWLKSYWGYASGIKIEATIKSDGIQLAGDAEVDFGYSLNTAGSMSSQNPIVIKADEGLVDGKQVSLLLTVKNSDGEVLTERLLTYKITNIEDFSGLITKNTVVGPGYYRISKPIGIQEGATLTFARNTRIILDNNITNRGRVIFQDGVDIDVTKNGDMENEDGGEIIFAGRKDNHVKITRYTHDIGTSRFDYTDVGTLDYYYVRSEQPVTITNSKIEVLALANINCTNLYVDSCDIMNLYEENYYFPRAAANRPLPIYNSNIFNPDAISSWNLAGDIYRNYENDRLGLTQFNSSLNYILTNKLNYNFTDMSTNPDDYPVPSMYLGTNSEKIIRGSINDYTNGYGWLTADLNPLINATPSISAPGVLCKILVDGYNCLDEFEQMPPLGVGTHTFQLVYNKPVDKTVMPSITMGLHEPFDRVVIDEDPSWNEDGTVYTVHLTINAKSSFDGLNYIHVSGGRDLNNFTLPEEVADRWHTPRMKVIVSKIGSMSTGLMATAGLGKVKLDWITRDVDFDDLMGFNVYRYEDVEEGTTSVDTIQVNETLVTPGEVDELGNMFQEYIDYDVVPGKTYYYFVKEMGTDMQTFDISTPVAVTPLSAQKGDANGSMSVDVADIMTDVAYIMNENPQPFIFEAADVNSDETINILDVIGTANMIIAPREDVELESMAVATYTVEDGVLYVESPVDLAGVQVSLRGNKEADTFAALDVLNGMEQLSAWQNDAEWIFLAFSMTGKTLPAGKHAILNISDAKIADIALSNPHGHNIAVIDGVTTSIRDVEEINKNCQGNSRLTTKVFDLSGREVYKLGGGTGVYIVKVYADGQLVKSYKLMNK